ncbi:related to bifunctional polynucleotide phosphatase/kinase [Melanopsichium pennsylvanicum]|uniref:Related to bifunctional polynucleotide phosphatase/kinase n=2 Tax=Melanopsichium pennsylvanicum TaxID=63383 RepID=A0AAJ4XMA9_9BASI|nr:related to bifunctional polynucleotide phosphatase/kinase [Melanopsichium pennsylvanicum 4]SNX85434.1 related to bifunctional polynucleotide phosphatase/kinase [Melanopsichium pennsylvanicum]
MLKRAFVSDSDSSASKRVRDDSDSDEPTLPTKAASSLKKNDQTSSTNTDVKKPVAKLASIFQPRVGPSSSANGEKTSPILKLKWLDPIGSNGTCLHGVYGEPQPCSKVAFYDLDGTLVRPKNGKTFPSKTDEYDFSFLFPTLNPSIVTRLRSQHDDGHAIVVITNQKQTQYSGKNGLATWKKKMGHIAAALDVPLRVFAALGDDKYRKPRLGMWDEFNKSNLGVEVDRAASFFVGDAAGRERSRDHQDTDLKWALNAGISFLTPEEYFLSQERDWGIPIRPWSPSALSAPAPSLTGLVHDPSSEMTVVDLGNLSETAKTTILGGDREQDASEIILFVGAPASGKTHLFTHIFAPQGYVHVNQDTLRTRDKCLRFVREIVTSNPPQSCVVDNTNRDKATRKYYVDLARELGVGIRCVYFDVPKVVCVHNNHFRAHHGPTREEGERRSLLPYTAIEGFFKDRQVPQRAEGFSAAIVRVKWGWNGADEAVRAKYEMYYH